MRSETVQDLKDFNLQSLTTQAKKGNQLVSMMSAIKKVFNLMGNDLVQLYTENESIQSKIGCYDEKWLEESKARLLQQFGEKKRANVIIFRMKKKQINKH